MNFYFQIICKLLVWGLAQMVERSLSMREVPGSIPRFSILSLLIQIINESLVYCVLKINGRALA